MRNCLLGVNDKNFINIGDYVQALASAQFYPHIDGFIQREKLKKYNGEQSNVIMNGWFIHDLKQWPPSDKINPLFVAFHINESAQEVILSEKSIAYLKKHEPIGCRDLFTTNILKNKGINAYFSGCMTLTLGYKYKSLYKEDKIYFVDPYVYVSKNPFYYLKRIPFFLKNIRKISSISRKWYGVVLSLRGLIKSTLFLQTYLDIFDEKVIMNGEYVSQADRSYRWPDKDKELLKYAEKLIIEYSKAKLVVTSRIHCALPCLGIETPVLFTIGSKMSFFSSCRLGGLIELFNVIRWEKGKLIPQFNLNGKINLNNTPNNKTLWKPIANDLKMKCIQFFK